jgi:hypothetical protein
MMPLESVLGCGTWFSLIEEQLFYQKGISLGKAAMQAIEERLERHPELPKYDILIQPASTS